MGLVGIVNRLFEVFRWLIIFRIIFSWIPTSPTSKGLNDVKEIIFNITEFYLRPFRNLIPPIRSQMGYIDLSAIVGLIALPFINRIVIHLLITILSLGGF